MSAPTTNGGGPSGNDILQILRRSWHYLALLAGAVWLIYQVRAILGPFLIGIVLGFILDPALDRLQRRGWSRSRAVLFVFLLGFLAVLAVVLVLVPVLLYQAKALSATVSESTKRLEAWVETMPGMEASFEEPAPDTSAEPAAAGRSEPEPAAESAAPEVESAPPVSAVRRPQRPTREEIAAKKAELRARWDEWYAKNLPSWAPHGLIAALPAPDMSDPAAGLAMYRGRIAEWGQRAAASIGGAVWGSVGRLFFYIFTPFVAFYFMRDMDSIRQQVWAWIPDCYHDRCRRASSALNSMLARYFRGQLLLMFLVFCTCLVMQTPIRLWLGTDHMLLVAAVDGLLYAVPVAGAWVASITAGVVGYVSADGNPWLAAIVMVVLIQVVNGVFDQVVSPKIAGEKVGLHPLVVIFSVLAGATLLGFVGMLVAVPTAAAIKIAIDTFMPEVLAKEREDAAEAGT